MDVELLTDDSQGKRTIEVISNVVDKFARSFEVIDGVDSFSVGTTSERDDSIGLVLKNFGFNALFIIGSGFSENN